MALLHRYHVPSVTMSCSSSGRAPPALHLPTPRHTHPACLPPSSCPHRALALPPPPPPSHPGQSRSQASCQSVLPPLPPHPPCVLCVRPRPDASTTRQQRKSSRRRRCCHTACCCLDAACTCPLVAVWIMCTSGDHHKTGVISASLDPECRPCPSLPLTRQCAPRPGRGFSLRAALRLCPAVPVPTVLQCQQRTRPGDTEQPSSKEVAASASAVNEPGAGTGERPAPSAAWRSSADQALLRRHCSTQPLQRRRRAQPCDPEHLFSALGATGKDDVRLFEAQELGDIRANARVGLSIHRLCVYCNVQHAAVQAHAAHLQGDGAQAQAVVRV